MQPFMDKKQANYALTIVCTENFQNMSLTNTKYEKKKFSRKLLY